MSTESADCPNFTELADYSYDSRWDGRFALELNEALVPELQLPPSHDEIEINGQRVFARADEVLHHDRRLSDPNEQYRIGEVLARTEARYGDAIVVMEQSIELPNRFTRDLAWTTEQQGTHQFRARAYDRGGDWPDNIVWSGIVQDRLSTFIPMPFFMWRATRLAIKAEEEALKLHGQ